MANRLIRKAGLYFIGNAATKLISAALIPVYAFFVTSSQLGAYDYLFALATMSAPIAFLAIWEAGLRFVISSDNPEEKDCFAANIIRFGLLCSALYFLLILFTSSFLGISASDSVLLALMLMMCGLTQIWQYLARGYLESKVYVISGASGAIFNLAAVLLFVCILNMGTLGLALGYIIGQASIMLIIERRIHLFRLITRCPGSIRKMKENIRILLKYSAPLSLNLFAGVFLSSFGRLVVSNYLGSAANGEYVFSMKFAALITAFGSVLGMASVEEGIIRANNSELSDYFSRLLDSTWKTLLSVGIFAVSAIKVFYLFLGNTSYENSYQLIPYFIVYAIFSILATSYGAIFQAANSTKGMGVTTLIAAAVTVILSIIGVVYFGTTGVAAALAAGMIIMTILRLIWSKHLVPHSINSKEIVVLSILFIFESALYIAWDSSAAFSVYQSGLFWLITVLFIVSGALFALRSFFGLTRIPDMN